ncbi:MAG TPA: hypothetical protein VHY32_01800, partial [Caulobacteraceae bacterium]|nr:hypothetical protein [Caulobacteraceae bacterium]
MTDAEYTDSILAEAEARAKRHGEFLEELAEIGMSLCKMLKSSVIAQLNCGETPDVAAVSLAFTRLSKSARQCVALEARLAERHGRWRERVLRALRTGKGYPGNLEGVKQPAALDDDALELGAVRKAVVKRAVAEMIERDARESEAPETEVERLLDDLYDRADEYDDIEYSDRPISEMI